MENPKNFDDKKFEKLFNSLLDDNLSATGKMLRYGFICGWLQCLFSADKVSREAELPETKTFKDACMKVLKEDVKNFEDEMLKTEKL